jgi:hypothetical protein
LIKAGHWWITAGKKLRSDYLAWASPYFAFIQPEKSCYSLFILQKQTKEFYCFSRKTSFTHGTLSTMPPQERSPGPPAAGREKEKQNQLFSTLKDKYLIKLEALLDN